MVFNITTEQYFLCKRVNEQARTSYAKYDQQIQLNSHAKKMTEMFISDTSAFNHQTYLQSVL